MTPDEFNTFVIALGSILTVLRDADPLDKAESTPGSASS
jgi:hypothetical protein